jgi:hypothetical protein
MMLVSETITYWVMGYGEREQQIRDCISRVRSYVDRAIVITDGSLSKEFKEWATKEMHAEVHYRRWNDDFSANRNFATSKISKGWMIWSDPDELFCVAFLKALRKIIEESNDGKKYNSCRINSHDVELDAEGNRKSDLKSSWYKQLLVKVYPGVKWTGTPHEALLGPWKSVQLPDDYFYEHFKTHKEVCERAARNFWIGGGGNNERTPKWHELMEIAKFHGWDEKRWPVVRELFRDGNVPQEFKDWLVKHRSDNDRPNVDCEIRDFFTWYFVYLHPEENTGDWKSEPKQPEAERDTHKDIKGAPVVKIKSLETIFDLGDYIDKMYMAILGRHADSGGKANYVLHLLAGSLKKEDIPKTLRESQEFKDKYGDLQE